MPDMPEELETRTKLAPRLGTKICLLVAIPFVLWGLALLLAPITDVRTGTGAVFDCGTAVNPPAGDFAQGVCQGVGRRYLLRGSATVLSGVLIAAAGATMFGADRRVEQELPRANDS